MKKFAISLLFLTICFPAISQIRFSKVDPSASTITIKNFGSGTIDISNYRLCALFQYTNSGLTPLTIVNGSLNLAPDSSVELSGFMLLSSASDLGLYLASGGFGDTSAMVDFLQWGSAGNGRESVANSKGIWNSGDFLNVTGPFFYNGDGGADGLNTWSNTSNSTGIFDNLIDKGSITVSPNPFTTSTSLRFEFAQNYAPGSISLTMIDLFGRIVKNKTPLSLDGKMVINRNNLTPGVYFLNVFHGQRVIALKKLVITD